MFNFLELFKTKFDLEVIPVVEVAWVNRVEGREGQAGSYRTVAGT